MTAGWDPFAPPPRAKVRVLPLVVGGLLLFGGVAATILSFVRGADVEQALERAVATAGLDEVAQFEATAQPYTVLLVYDQFSPPSRLEDRLAQVTCTVVRSGAEPLELGGLFQAVGEQGDGVRTLDTFDGTPGLTSVTCGVPRDRDFGIGIAVTAWEPGIGGSFALRFGGIAGSVIGLGLVMWGVTGKLNVSR